MTECNAVVPYGCSKTPAVRAVPMQRAHYTNKLVDYCRKTRANAERQRALASFTVTQLYRSSAGVLSDGCSLLSVGDRETAVLTLWVLFMFMIRYCWFSNKKLTWKVNTVCKTHFSSPIFPVTLFALRTAFSRWKVNLVNVLTFFLRLRRSPRDNIYICNNHTSFTT